jgi:hypothetical protein
MQKNFKSIIFNKLTFIQVLYNPIFWFLSKKLEFFP